MSIAFTPTNFPSVLKTFLVNLGMAIEGDRLSSEDETNFVAYAAHHYGLSAEAARASIGHPTLLPVEFLQEIRDVYEGEEPEEPEDPEDPVDPPEDPVDPPEDPQAPPEDPQAPPEDPQDPPEEPQDPPEDPPV